MRRAASAEHCGCCTGMVARDRPPLAGAARWPSALALPVFQPLIDPPDLGLFGSSRLETSNAPNTFGPNTSFRSELCRSNDEMTGSLTLLCRARNKFAVLLSEQNF
jgi:hypothetical protein